MKPSRFFSALFLIISLCLSTPAANASTLLGNGQKGTNVILFIGDGMSLAQWETGMIMSEAPLNIEKMHSIGIVQTNPLRDFNGDGPSHGTAIATGVNSHKGAVSVDNGDKPVKSIIEYASENGLATGIVSANTLFEGSIVPFVAHVKSRMQTEEIAKAYIDRKPDIFIGGGMKIFSDSQKDGKSLLEKLKENGYGIAKSLAEAETLKANKLAVFTSETDLPNISNGREGVLKASVNTALNQLAKSKNGFFMVVGNMFIDRASHAEDAKTVGLETIDFDKAIGTALDFAKTDGNTIVVVVGGPEASGMTLVDGDIKKHEVVGKWTMKGMIHTGTMVPVFAYGVGAEKFQGIMKSTDLFFIIKKLLLKE